MDPNQPPRPEDNPGDFSPEPPYEGGSAASSQPPLFNDEPPPSFGDPAPASPPPSPQPEYTPPSPAPDPAYTPPPPPPGQPTTYATPPSAPATTAGSISKDERNWAMFSHLSPLAAGLLGTMMGLTFLSFLGPLIIYLVKKDESPFVADQAKEALNFSISVSITFLILALLTLPIITGIITVPLMLLVGIGALILAIIAAIAASNGEAYRYPFTIRFIK